MISRHICGVVLSGGKSSRMGKDKGLILYRGKPLVSYILTVLSMHADAVYISTDNNEYRIFGYPLIADQIPGIGPIGGIYSSFKQVSADGYIFSACDIPELAQDIILQMIKASEKVDIVFLKPSSGKPQPLPLFLGQKTFPLIQQMVDEQKYKLQDIITEAIQIGGFKLNQISLSEELKNINSPSDLD